MLAQSTGWATAARECVEVAAPEPVISFGARHVHPDITDILDYAAIVGGCVGASTPAGARLAGLAPTGTMPHSLVLIFGDTVKQSGHVLSSLVQFSCFAIVIYKWGCGLGTVQLPARELGDCHPRSRTREGERMAKVQA